MPWDSVLSARNNPNILSHLRALFQRMILMSHVGCNPCGFRNRLLFQYRPFARSRMHPRYLFPAPSSSYSLRTPMTTMDSSQRTERRGIRYPLQLPVSLKLAHKEIHARTEIIGLWGMLLSSAFLIPEGSTVQVAIGIAQLPAPGTQLSARGKVLRVHPKPTGDFGVAIAFESPFELGLQSLNLGSGCPEKRPRLVQEKNRTVTKHGLHLVAAWYTET
jgi:hypothetical protein